MKIRVDLDVPDGDLCDRCKHYRYYRRAQKYKCEVFQRYLKYDENYNLKKCLKCKKSVVEE